MRNAFENDIRPLVRRLGKPPEEWQRRDLVDLVLGEGIRVIHFRYASFDGKLRQLSLPVNDRKSLERLLAAGERVDGSSLFPGLLHPGESDLYAVPVYRWAFLDPWAPDELHLVCRFADAAGEPAPTPDNLLASVAAGTQKEHDLRLLALAELEFYLVLERDHERFTGKPQRNYHQSAPYVHGRAVADEILRAVAAISGGVKYGHSEVGYIDRLQSADPELDGKRLEQYELEFDLMPIEDLGTWLSVARWLIRATAARHGASVTFAPKLDEDMAGSGMHLHLALERQGKNVLHDGDGELSDAALRLVGGLLEHAAPLTGFANTVASSYLRLVPGQEAPTRVCWARRNRSSLIRIPLSFNTPRRLDLVMNPRERGPYPEDLARPTVEYRSPDGSAFPHLLLAAVARAVAAALGSPESRRLAERLEVDGDLAERPRVAAELEELPPSAVAAARILGERREFFEAGGFPAALIDLVIERLVAEADDGLSERLRALPAAERLAESRRVMHKDLHKH